MFELHKFPHEFFELDRNEKAAVMAFIDVYGENKKREEAKLRRGGKRK